MGGQPLSISSNVTVTAVAGEITLTQTNATNLQIGLANYNSPSTCTWANVVTDAKGRSTCTSNTPPLTSLIAGVGTYVTSSNQVNTYVASIKDYGAFGDGITDDAVALQLAASDATNLSVYLPAGMYLTSQRIVFNVTGKNFIGFGTVVIAPTLPFTASTAIIGISAPFVSLQGITLDGRSNGDPAAIRPALVVLAASHVVLKECVFRDTNSYGIFNFASIDLRNITIIDNTFARFLGAAGIIQMAGAGTIQDVRISGNYIYETTSGMAIGPTGSTRNKRIVYSGNRFFNGNTTSVNSACMYASNADGVTITANQCSAARFGTSTNNVTDMTIASNQFTDIGSYAIETICDQEVVISSNTFDNCQSGIFRRTSFLWQPIVGMTIVGNTWRSPVLGNSFYVSGIARNYRTVVSGNVIKNGSLDFITASSFSVAGNTMEDAFVNVAVDSYDGSINGNTFVATYDLGGSACVVSLLGNGVSVVGNLIRSNTTVQNSARGICNNANLGPAELNNTLISNNFVANFAQCINTGVNSPNNYNTRHTDNAFNDCGTNDLGSATDAVRPQRIAQFNVAPPSGTWSTGDVVWNNFATSAAGPLMWVRSGSQWLVPTTIAGPYSASIISDTSITLTPGSSAPLAFYQAPITANRAVSLSTTGVWAGIMWTVVRGKASSGSFNITAGAGLFLCTLQQPGQWCSFTYQASQYLLVGGGTIP